MVEVGVVVGVVVVVEVVVVVVEVEIVVAVVDVVVAGEVVAEVVVPKIKLLKIYPWSLSLHYKSELYHLSTSLDNLLNSS